MPTLSWRATEECRHKYRGGINLGGEHASFMDFFEAVPPRRVGGRAGNSAQGALAWTEFQYFSIYFSISVFQGAAGRVVGRSFCSIRGYLHPLKINWCESSALCAAGDGAGRGAEGEGWCPAPGSAHARLWTSC